MKNKHINPEKEPLWFNILMWIIAITVVSIIVFGVIFIIESITPKEVPAHERCSNECNKFNMKYYKIDYNTGVTYICWCIDADGKPKSVGAV